MCVRVVSVTRARSIGLLVTSNCCWFSRCYALWHVDLPGAAHFFLDMVGPVIQLSLSWGHLKVGISHTGLGCIQLCMLG